MLEALERITRGEGRAEDITLLEDLAGKIKEASLCALGQTAPNPVLSTLRYFRNEYETHILEHRCPAGSCLALVEFRIDPGKCTGCTLCARNCPVAAISGERGKTHLIDTAKCVKCGRCLSSCNFSAVLKA